MEVFFTNCTRNPTVGGSAIRSACGRMTWRYWWVRVSARDADASHGGTTGEVMTPGKRSGGQ